MVMEEGMLCGGEGRWCDGDVCGGGWRDGVGWVGKGWCVVVVE